MNKRDAIQTAIAIGAVSAIGYGLWSIYQPLCPLGIGLLLLTGIIYARTRPQ